MTSETQRRSKLDNWGGPYSYIRVHRPWKQSISNEINCAEREYMNMCPPNYWVCYVSDSETPNLHVSKNLNISKTKQNIEKLKTPLRLVWKCCSDAFKIGSTIFRRSGTLNAPVQSAPLDCEQIEICCMIFPQCDSILLESLGHSSIYHG